MHLIFSLIITLLFNIPSVFSETKDNLNFRFKSLMHYGKDTHSRVVTPSFFLSKTRVLKDEVQSFIDKINSDEAQEYACRFPARYFLLKKIDPNTTAINLKKCKKLQNFLKKIHKDRISIAITSEFLNAPASAFGHILLVLGDMTDNYYDHDVIHYSAITNQEDGIFIYNFKGLTGGYKGKYFTDKFFNKLFEYLHKEQRYIFLYDLNLNQKQKDLILFHIFELHDVHFDYFFLNDNCGSKIHELLNITLPNNKIKNYIYTLPIEIPRAYKDKITATRKIIPLVTSSKKILGNLSEKDKETFNLIIKGDEKLNSKHSKNLKRLTYYYYKYQFLKNAKALPNYRSNLKKSLIEEIDPRLDKIISPLEDYLPRKLSLGGSLINAEYSPEISFRPVLFDSETLQKYKIHESTLEVLDLSFYYSKKSLKLSNLDFLNVELLAPASYFFGASSWRFLLNLNRVNKKQNLSPKIEFGYGMTFFEDFKIYSLLLLGNGNHYSNQGFYIGPEVGTILYFGDKIKIRFFSSYYFLKSSFSYLHSAALTLGVKENLDLVISFEAKKELENRSSLKLNYFF